MLYVMSKMKINFLIQKLNYGRNTCAEKKEFVDMGVDPDLIADRGRNSSLCNAKEPGRTEQNFQPASTNIFFSASRETSIVQRNGLNKKSV